MRLSLLLYLLTVRFKSLLRFLKELGIVRLALLALLGTGFIQAMISLKASFTGSAVLVILPLSILYSYHSLRKDEKFVKMLDAKYRLFYFTEYLLISLFFIIVLLFSPYYYFTLMLFTACAVIPFASTNLKPGSFAFKTRLNVPPYAFEWVSGLRRYGLFLGAVYLLALIFSYEIGAVPLALMLIAFTIPSFYVSGEPRVMVEVFGMPPGKFLRFKLFSALKLYLILSLPLLGAFMLFNYDRWYLAIGIYLITCVIITSSVLTKYAFYEENNMISHLNLLITGIIIFSIISAFYLTGPFLFILPLFMLVYLYRKAVQNLKFYLHAYN